jgi:hypothetical protein
VPAAQLDQSEQDTWLLLELYFAAEQAEQVRLLVLVPSLRICVPGTQSDQLLHEL